MDSMVNTLVDFDEDEAWTAGTSSMDAFGVALALFMPKNQHYFTEWHSLKRGFPTGNETVYKKRVRLLLERDATPEDMTWLKS